MATTTDRVLIEIASVANMAGVSEAKAGLSALSLASIGAGVALAALFVAGKDMVAISQEHFRAEVNLANAIRNRHASTRNATTGLEQFMQTNRDFIANQNEVINSYANLLREGVKQKDVLGLLSTALKIQSVNGGTLADSVLKLQQAEVGRNRGLATQLGLVLKTIPAHATLAQKQAIVAHNISEINRAYGRQKPVLDPLTVATNHLKTDWEQMAEKYGPDLVTILSQLAGGAEAFLNALGDPNKWSAINDRLTAMARGARAIALQLGIAQPDAAEKAGPSTKRDPLAGLSPAARAAYIKAFPQYGAAAAKGEAVNAALAAAAQARKNAQWQAEMLQHQKEYLYWLKSMSTDTHHMAQDIRDQKYKPVIVHLDAQQIANAIRISDRRLR